jgi:hypothetical protein
MFIKPSLCGLFVTAAMVSAGVAGSAQAGVAFVPEATVEVGVLGDTSTTKVGLLNTANPNQFSSSGQWDNANWDFTWDMTVDLDPFINGVFGVTNNTGSTQTFILNVTIPVPSWAARSAAQSPTPTTTASLPWRIPAVRRFLTA